MTKKDYELIAYCIRDAIEYADIPFSFADELEKRYPNFDRAKFLVACGVADN